MAVTRSTAAALALSVALSGTTAAGQALPELVGEPFLQYWPDAPYPRNIWDMIVYDDRLYFGAGNSSNVGPSPNAGPVPVVSWSPETGFVEEFIVDEEQVALFRILDGDLYIPGHDATEDWGLGNFYTRAGGVWSKHRVVPNAVHVYDMAIWNGLLFAAGGATEGVGAWLSSDEGRSWRPVPLLPNADLALPGNPGGSYRILFSRLYSVFTLGDRLLFSGTAQLAAQGWAGGPESLVAVLFEYDAANEGLRAIELLQSFPPAAAALAGAGVDLLPDRPSLDGSFLVATSVRRHVELDDGIAYIAANAFNDHQWNPYGLYHASSLAGRRSLTVPEGYQPHDILVHDDRLYVLLNRPHPAGGGYDVAVAAADLPALDRWEIVARADMETFAQSFEIYRGDLYLGLGSTVAGQTLASGPASVWASQLSEASGQVWRLPLPR